MVRLVRSGTVGQALVFVRTKHGADRLASHLARAGISVGAIHSNKSQPHREAALEDFKSGRAMVLVATEVAARGIDITALPHVINYDLPMVTSDYVHRIGRTGRAGVDGVAISLVSPEEMPQLADIERLLSRSIPREPIPNAGAGPAPRRNEASGERPARRRGWQPHNRQSSAGRSGAWSGLPGERRTNGAAATVARPTRPTG
jgi:ATP-dependent RNA helicase RhlE